MLAEISVARVDRRDEGPPEEMGQLGEGFGGREESACHVLLTRPKAGPLDVASLVTADLDGLVGGGQGPNGGFTGRAEVGSQQTTLARSLAKANGTGLCPRAGIWLYV